MMLWVWVLSVESCDLVIFFFQKWNAFLMQFEGRVVDWNMGTLLRLDSKGGISDENTILGEFMMCYFSSANDRLVYRLGTCCDGVNFFPVFCQSYTKYICILLKIGKGSLFNAVLYFLAWVSHKN